ncbi:hypothetical protein H311_03254, partial [Anncaliia algerae PRA109]
MLLPFLFITKILTGAITIKPNSQFVFYEEFKKGERIKFECSENDGMDYELVIHNGNPKETLTELKLSYVVLHTEAQENMKLHFIFKNTNSDSIKIWFMLPDVTKEIQGPLGPVDGQDVVAELKNTLENIYVSQKNHIAKQIIHEKNVKNAKNTMFFFFMFEFFFNVFIAIYFYNDIVKLF